MNTIDGEAEWDLIVIGGGAAGFFGAICAAEHAPRPLKIVILERSSQVLGKVKISGGGRCNVTHDCLEPKALSTHYPRGEKSLIGAFHQFGPAETMDWFSSKGVELKVETDGRIFPTTDSSQTIIDCLMQTAESLGIQVFTKTGVTGLKKKEDGFFLTLNEETEIKAQSVLLATGGTRLAAGAKLAEALGHTLLPAVPSLFTFSINHPLLDGLEGVSVHPVRLQINGTAYKNTGPVLITHWGLSGPGVLKLSALAARDLASCGYSFSLEVNWCPDVDMLSIITLKRKEWGKRQMHTRSPLASIPKRLWGRFCDLAEIPEGATWSRLTREQSSALCALVKKCVLPVSGKSINKEEFVTCGGVELKEVQMKTLESKITPGLFLAGEVLNIDGVTGGFNFQNAWTGGYLAGRAISERAGGLPPSLAED